jgi:hypothetical protein
VGIDPLIVILSCAFVYICGIVGLKQPEYRLYAFHMRLVPRMTYGLHLIKVACQVFVSPTIVDMVSATEGHGYGVCNGGPLTGNKRNNLLINGVVSCS